MRNVNILKYTYGRQMKHASRNEQTFIGDVTILLFDPSAQIIACHQDANSKFLAVPFLKVQTGMVRNRK